MCQELNVRINMVRTKLLPKPFLAPSHKKPLRLENEPNENTIQSGKIHFPVRVMLKAKRKFTGMSGIKEFYSGALSAKEISQVHLASLPRQAARAPRKEGHRHQKRTRPHCAGAHDRELPSDRPGGA